MQYLEGLVSRKDVAWYRLKGDHQGRIRRYMVSTAPSREICNQPEILGMEFTSAMEQATELALRHAPFAETFRQPREEKICVVHFLRGGLNFGLRRALHRAYGINRHSSAFMSSQRRRVDGRWLIEEDMYRKLDIPDGAILVMGDVVATGVTMENGLRVIADHVRDIGSSVRSLVFFTIGCHKAEKALEDLDNLMRDYFPDYESTSLVYMEAKFRLVDSRTELRIGIPGTDLIRKQALLTPEFELSGFDSLSFALERCAIYDAGSRAFDIPHYVHDVRGYWQQLASFASRGWTLAEALKERWPHDEYLDEQVFMETKRATWPDLAPDLLALLRQRWKERWLGAAGTRLDTAVALKELCRQRLESLWPPAASNSPSGSPHGRKQ